MKPSQIQLTENRILVKIDEASDTTEAGIVVTEETVKMEMNLGEFQTGIVISKCVTGGLRMTDSEWSALGMVETGLRVLFLHFAGKDIKFDGVPHKILRSEEIFAVVSEPTPT